MSKIEKLTQIQEKRLVEVRDYWLKVGLSTARADRQTTENSITQMYGLIDKKRPRFIWMYSPFGAMISISLAKKCMKMGANLWANLRANLGANLRANLGANLGANLRANLGANLGANLWENLGANLRENLGANLWANLGANLGANLRANLGANLGANLRANLGANLFEVTDFWGSFDSYWIAYYKFAKEIGVPYDKTNIQKLNLWSDLAHSCFWWWPYENVCFVSERPTAIHRDERGRLHYENGLAIEFKDGYGMFAWHGTRVKEKIIMRPKELSAKEISDETNSEISRAIAEKLGWDRYMKILRTKLIDKWFDPTQSLHYELYDFIDRKFSLMPRLLKMESPETNEGTRPQYIEPVDPKLQSCKAARRWQFLKTNGEWPTVEECNENPELIFEVEA